MYIEIAALFVKVEGESNGQLIQSTRIKELKTMVVEQTANIYRKKHFKK